MTYDELLIEAENKGLNVKEKPLRYGFKGLYKNKKIIIDKNIETNNEKNVILAEELGHHQTSVGNILDLSDIRNLKQEKKARNWAYEKHVGVISLINAFEKGIRTRSELAEYLNVTEKFLGQAIDHYREKYGVQYEIDHYIIRFEPNFAIIKLF